MATKKKPVKKNKKGSKQPPLSDYLHDIDIDSHIDGICKKLDLTPVFLKRGSYVKDAISTGILTYDLITGGGNAPGRWTTLFGPEGGGKSTFSVFAITYATSNKIRCHFFDHEGSLDPEYSERMGLDIDKTMGMKNEKGVWEINPWLRYYQPDTGHMTFRYIRRVLKTLPDKIYTGGEWWLIFNKKTWEDKLKKMDLKPKKKDGALWLKSPDGGKVQAVFFIDSLASMLAEARDEDDTKSPMAQNARMFSEYMPLVKAQLAKKRCSVISTNQVRNTIGGYGNPETEPGGFAPKHYSDMRCRVSAVSVIGGKGPIEEESCWDGKGKDRYKYIKMNTIKNKSFSPFRKSHLRIWFEEKGRPGRGIDPVYDTYQYLMETGQCEANRGRYKILLKGFDGKSFTWKEFKYLILNPNIVASIKKFKLTVDIPKKCDKDISKIEKLLAKKDTKAKGKKLARKLNKKLDAVINLRTICRAQINDGSAFEMYFERVGEQGPSEGGK